MNFIKVFILLIALGYTNLAVAQYEEDFGQLPTPDLSASIFGEVGFYTNYIEKGISQTENQPVVQAGMGYQFGKQFRLGFWGNSVRYADSLDSSHVKIYANYIVPFSPNAYAIIGLYMHQYWPDQVRNGQETTIALKLFTYNIAHEKRMNFEGLGVSAQRYSLSKDFNFVGKWLVRLEGGYNTIKSDEHESYFDTKAGLVYPVDRVQYQIFAVTNTKPDQFPGRTSTVGVAGLTAKF